MDDITRLNSIFESLLQRAKSIESKSKDAYGNLRKEVEELKEKYRLECQICEDLRERLKLNTQQIETLEKELEFEKSNHQKKKLRDERDVDQELDLLKKELSIETQMSEKLRKENETLKSRNAELEQPRRSIDKRSHDGDNDNESNSSRSEDCWKRQKKGNSSSNNNELPELRVMREDEAERELCERFKRTNQLVINDDLSRSFEAIRELVNNVQNWKDTWTLIEQTVEGEWLVKLDKNWKHKEILVKKRNWYKDNYGLYFRDNHTLRQKEVYRWLRALGQIERQKGNKVTVNESDIVINSVCKVFDERRGELVIKSETSPY